MLNITTQIQDGIEFIVLEGEIDMYVAPKVRDILLEACKTCAKGVAVDLSGVPYMDSSGIATLVEGLQWSKREGGRFMLVGLQERVEGTLRLAKLEMLFDRYASREEALESCR